MTKRHNLYIDQGTNFSFELDFIADDYSGVDLSEYMFYSEVRKLYSSSLAFEFDVNLSSSNTLIISTTPDDTKTLTPGKYNYDVIIKSPSNIYTKVLEGLVFMIGTTTKIEET